MNAQERAYNYLFRGGDLQHNLNDPYELMDRVASGVKPVASIWRSADHTKYCSTRGLLTFTKTNRWGGRPVEVYKHKDATLSEYWNLKELVVIYKGKVRKATLAKVLKQPIREMMDQLAEETIPFWHIGLLYGFPPEETVNCCAGPWYISNGPCSSDSDDGCCCSDTDDEYGNE